MHTVSPSHTHTHTVSANLSAHLLLISDDMNDAKWEIWISFLCRQSLIHWQKAQMWEDDFCDLDLSRFTPSGSHVVLWAERLYHMFLDGYKDAGSDSGKVNIYTMCCLRSVDGWLILLDSVLKMKQEFIWLLIWGNIRSSFSRYEKNSVPFNNN